jgi:hypothetical protein
MSLTISSGGLTNTEVEHIRLGLSVFQDGTGWETIHKRDQQGLTKVTFAGYRQFERLIADIFGGAAPEDKGIFDVLLPVKDSKRYYGISCKMKGELDKAEKVNGQVYIELSNAAGGFTDAVNAGVGIDFHDRPEQVGTTLLDLIGDWHKKAADNTGLDINLKESSFLVLLYNKKLRFRLYQYKLTLPRADQLTWRFPPSTKNPKQGSRRLAGYTADDALVLEWYLYSGGQLKYYPSSSNAHWVSKPFELEALPENIESGLAARAKEYFPKLWKLGRNK